MERSDLLEKITQTLNSALSTIDNSVKVNDISTEQLYYNYVYNKYGKKQTATNYRWAISIEEFKSHLKEFYNVTSIYDISDPTTVLQIRDEILEKPYNKKNKNSTSASLAQYAEFLSERFEQLMPMNDVKEDVEPENKLIKGPLQQIFYGAPGTGKSHKVKEVTDSIAKEFVFRTTFHPDSDYSTFVGAYKPTMKQLPIFNQQTGAQIGVEDKIVYSFVPQAFLKAYVAAWQNPKQSVFLVIEEINRGNCAQIFGDIFQLLDRNDNGESEYPIKADQDIQDYLAKEFACVAGLEDNIQSGEELMLPANLHIWATMNTSDQSLFPIDSAFKRRWDWEYVPIKKAEDKNWKIKVGETTYDWWKFIEAINEQINTTTSSEDKKIGHFFCKTCEGDNILAAKFVNKVIFYLWNDVFKDYELPDAFKKADGHGHMSFNDFYTKQDECIHQLMKNLKVQPDGQTEEPTEEIEA